jgi:hypothetical protein
LAPVVTSYLALWQGEAEHGGEGITMKNKARWAVTIGALVLVLGSALAEVSGDRLSAGIDWMSEGKIARLIGAGNALTLVP